MTRYVQIDYTLKPDINHGEVKEAIGEFVASIASHHPDHRYTSFQYASDDRFVHVGEIVEDVVADFQARPSSGSPQFLRERCATGPEVTLLNHIASAR